jgi:hypothetical protein
MVVAASPEQVLRAYIESEDALRAVYGQSAAYWGSDTRAEAMAVRGPKRHALVLYKTAKVSSGLGQKYCNVALGRKERNKWLDDLAAAAGGDRQVAKRLVSAASPTIRLKRVEYSELREWNGWLAGVCVVQESNITVTFPALPEATRIRQATYAVAKQLYAAGEEEQALERFKSLKEDPVLYPNALLYVVAILYKSHPEIAKALSKNHVDLERVNDLDALEAYARHSVTER